MTLFELLFTAVFGLVVGAIAKLLLPGRDPGGIVVTALIGIAGSFIGTFIGRYALHLGSRYQARWLMSIVGAIVLLLIFRLFSGRRAD